MERILARILIFSLLFLVAYSCEKKEIEQEPEEGAYIGYYYNILGKVIINDSLLLPTGEDYNRNWAIDISAKALKSEKWTIDSSLFYNGLVSDSILAPSETLPDAFKVNNLKVVFSAERYNTWGELTQPYFRGVYGWKVVITRIGHYQ